MEENLNIVGVYVNNLSINFISFLHRFLIIKSTNYESKEKLQRELDDLFGLVKNWLYDVVNIVDQEEFEQIIEIIHQNIKSFESIVINVFLEILVIQYTNCQPEIAKNRIGKFIKIFENILNSPPPKGGVSFRSFFYHQYLPKDPRLVRCLRGLFS